MCCYKTLESNEHGYVMRCNSCRHIHVAFGNTILAFTYDQLIHFYRTIQAAREDNKYNCCRDTKSIQIPTAARAVMLVYSINELEHFHSLLNKAIKKLDDEKLFIFSHN